MQYDEILKVQRCTNKQKAIKLRNKFVINNLDIPKNSAKTLINKFKLSYSLYDEIYSDACLGFFKAIDNFNIDKVKTSNLKNYLGRTCYYRLIDIYRKRMKTRGRKYTINVFSMESIRNENDDKIELEDESIDTVDDILSTYDSFFSLLNLIELTAEEIVILKFRFGFGLGMSEIGDIIGCSESRVSQKNKEAFEKIKEYFSEKGLNGEEEILRYIDNDNSLCY